MHLRRSNRGAFVYIIANKSLYTGVAQDLLERIRDHKEKRFITAYTAKYNFDRLVYFEWLSTLKEAAAREKQIKAWTRAKRVALIQQHNPNWVDLTRDLLLVR